MLFEFFIKVFQGLWNDLYIRNNRHKVRITVPARNDMKVEMADKTSPGRLSQINAEVKTLGFHYFCEEFFHVSRQFHNFKHFRSSEVRNVCLMFVGRNHEMPAV